LEVSFTVVDLRCPVLDLGQKILGGFGQNSETLDLFLSHAVLGDVHDLVFEDKQIRSSLTGEAHHILVVVLDPAVDQLAVHKLERNRLLPLSKSLQKIGFFEGIFRGRRAPTLGVGIPMWPKRHARIVHNASCILRIRRAKNEWPSRTEMTTPENNAD